MCDVCVCGRDFWSEIWRIHEAASCVGEIKRDFLGGGVTWMDSLINNHHPFLPDLNWSHMRSLEPRHRQLNVH